MNNTLFLFISSILVFVLTVSYRAHFSRMIDLLNRGMATHGTDRPSFSHSRILRCMNTSNCWVLRLINFLKF